MQMNDNFATLNVSGLGPIEGVATPNNGGSILEQSVAVHTRRTTKQLPVPSTNRDIEEFVVSRIGRSIIEDFSVQQDQHTDTPCTGRGNTEPSTVQDTLGRVSRQSAIQRSGECCIEESAVAHIYMDSELPVSSNSGAGEADTDMAEADIVDHPLILSEDHPLILSEEREIPFTYLACLLAKWAAKEDSLSSIRGKIKCFLTGVKGFQFRQRSIYELRVYVDDGSLISEVLVDHHVVEKGIGYSPKEVTAALSSSDKTTSSNMREAMKRFQLFLTKFEGTMLVEINKEQTVPVAVEMNQSFSTSDAWLLLKRLQTFTASPTAQQQCLNIIDVSP
ncbi:hypothetical protein Taro_026429 [Colocasia esculenta]|uniref:RecQ-mediated genome instability protein 1 C-terminal OB-fold domain-containing protein n=1 Tax=Colocasia esculenta TaxID=4460 RepID=A0A843VBE1_COLES|nr:hypothetical protein [Colocasia esculenta]